MMGRNAGVLTARWPVYGVISLVFNGTTFQMYSLGDDHLVNTLYYRKKYTELNDLRLFMALAKRSSVVFDVGANTGLYSILTHKVAPGARLFSFEPSPSNLKRLKKNLELNETITEVVDRVVGDKKSTVPFYVPSDNSISDTSSVLEEFSLHSYNGKVQWKLINIGQTTLDNFVKEKDIKKVDLVKIDVEGYEKAVFEGAKCLLEKERPVIQCEIFLDSSRKAFFDSILKRYGYTAYMILNDGLLRTDQDILVNRGNRNYLLASQKTHNAFSPFNNFDDLATELMEPK